MILFKRVGSAFRGIEGREWALLTLETLGVVAGIMIAFWLNEWAAQRDGAAKHHEMMERLLEESKNDISVARDWRNTLREMLTKEQTFAVKLGAGQCPPSSDFSAASTLTLFPALTVPRAVHDEMMGAGGLSSIDRQDVRDDIAIFYGSLDWVQRQIDFFRESRVEPLARDDTRVKTRFDPASQEFEITEFDARSLCSDQAFKNRVAAATRDHTVFTSYFEDVTRAGISMCVRIADSLGETCDTKLGGPLKGDDAAFARKMHASMEKEKRELGIH